MYILTTHTSEHFSPLEPELRISLSTWQPVFSPSSNLSQNRDGVYFLSAAAGYQISVDRLNELARSLETAPVDNYDLFPVGTSDKLSSVTLCVYLCSQLIILSHTISSWLQNPRVSFSLLKTLENTQMIYQSARLGASIARLTTLQSTLEAQVGYRGEAALALFSTWSESPSNQVNELTDSNPFCSFYLPLPRVTHPLYLLDRPRCCFKRHHLYTKDLYDFIVWSSSLFSSEGSQPLVFVCTSSRQHFCNIANHSFVVLSYKGRGIESERTASQDSSKVRIDAIPSQSRSILARFDTGWDR